MAAPVSSCCTTILGGLSGTVACTDKGEFVTVLLKLWSSILPEERFLKESPSADIPAEAGLWSCTPPLSGEYARFTSSITLSLISGSRYFLNTLMTPWVSVVIMIGPMTFRVFAVWDPLYNAGVDVHEAGEPLTGLSKSVFELIGLVDNSHMISLVKDNIFAVDVGAMVTVVIGASFAKNAV